MSEPEAPKIEFPCDYPIKVMGRASADFREVIISVMKTHAPEITESSVSMRESSNGTFHSLTVTIRATGKPQIDAIFEDLKKTGRVTVVL